MITKGFFAIVIQTVPFFYASTIIAYKGSMQSDYTFSRHLPLTMGFDNPLLFKRFLEGPIP